MNMQFFITGTDTSIGKTLCTTLLAKHFIEEGYHVLTQKWIQSGLDGQNTDLETHLTVLDKTLATPYLKAMCPYTLSFPASPHLSAQKEHIHINEHRITTAFHALKKQCDVLLVEGSGGFLVPYSDQALMSDIVSKLSLPIILVVGNKLGCINHALLTIEAIHNRKLHIHGLIFNTVDPTCPHEILEDNIKTILSFSKLHHIGTVPHIHEAIAAPSLSLNL